MFGRKVFAARDGDGAKPRSIGPVTIAAIAGEGVLCRGGCVAGDLFEGERKIFVKETGLVIVEVTEGREVQIGVRVVGDSVGNISTEGEIVDDGAVPIWKRLEASIVTAELDGDAMLTGRMRNFIPDLVVKFTGLNTSKPLPATPWELFLMIAQYEVPGFSPLMWNSCFMPPVKFVFKGVTLASLIVRRFFIRAQDELEMSWIDELFGLFGYKMMLWGPS